MNQYSTGTDTSNQLKDFIKSLYNWRKINSVIYFFQVWYKEQVTRYKTRFCHRTMPFLHSACKEQR